MAERDLAKDLEDLRAATRAAHEAAQELKDAAREARAVKAEIETAAAVVVDERIEEALKAGLAELDASIKTAIEASTAAVYNRFDTVADILMGESKQQRRDGQPSIPEYAEIIAQINAAHCTRHEKFTPGCPWCDTARQNIRQAVVPRG